MKYDIWSDCRNSMETGDAWLIGAETAEDVYKAANRYEALRKLTPQEFTALWKRSLTGENTFDSLVDELIV